MDATTANSWNSFPYMLHVWNVYGNIIIPTFNHGFFFRHSNVGCYLHIPVPSGSVWDWWTLLSKIRSQRMERAPRWWQCHVGALLNLVGGFNQSNWKDMLVKMGRNLPQVSGWTFQKIFELPPPRNYLRDHGFLSHGCLPAQRDGGLCGDERKNSRRTLAFEITNCCWKKSWTTCLYIEHENFYETKGCSPSNWCRNSSINSMKTISWLKRVSVSKRCLPRLISSSNCIQQKH